MHALIINQLSTHWDPRYISGSLYLSPLLLANSSHLFYWTHSYVSSTWDSQTLSQFYISAPWSRNVLQEVSQSNQRAHLTHFQSFKDHYPSLLMYKDLKTVVSFILSFFIVTGRRVNLFPITPMWPELEVIFYFKHNEHACFITFSDNSNTCSFWRSVSVVCCFCQILIDDLFPCVPDYFWLP